MDNGGLRYGAVEGALRPPLPTATQSALHDPTILLGLRRPKIRARLTDPSRRNIIAPIRGSERWVAGIKSESRPASDRNRWPASFGIRSAVAPRILVVDDDEDLAFLLTYNLKAEGYSAESAHRGEDAELRLAELSPDLLILDWMLPGVSGIEICARLRAREETRTLPIIMLTGRGDEAERVRGLSAGVDDYVVKPFSMPELMARVRGC